MDWNSLEQKDAYLNGVRLRYRIGGSGRPLLLLHGSPQSSLAWRKLVPLLPDGYLIVAPDLRGYGDSDKPGWGYDVRTMVDDVRQLVAQLNLGRADVVGHDLGAIVGYFYTALRPAEVGRLGIMEAPILGVPSPTLEPVLASYWHIGFYAHPRLPELLLKGRERAYLAEFFRTYAYTDPGIDDATLGEYARHLAAPGGITALAGVYRSIADEMAALMSYTKAKLPMPVWAVGGHRSMGMGPFEQFKQLAENVQGGVIRDCGHWIAEEQPVVAAEELARFLG